MTTAGEGLQLACQPDDDWKTLVRALTAIMREHLAAGDGPAVARAGRLADKAAEQQALYASLRRQLRLLQETLWAYRRTSAEILQLTRPDDGA